MKLFEAKRNIGKEAFLINDERVVIVKVTGDSSCMVMAGPDLDKYTYVQLGDLVSAKERESSRCLK